MLLLGGLFLAFFWFLYFLFEMMAVYIILVIVAGIFTVVFTQQNKLLYMPVIPDMPRSPAQNPHPYRHPSAHNLITDDLELVTADGFKIRGWHVKQNNPERVIVYFHENAGNIGFRIPLMKQISLRTNSDVILVAYRGFSDSQGVPTEAGLQKDGQAIIQKALDYAQKHNPKLKVFIYGRSLGGAVAIYIGSHPQFKNKISGLILENTFTSISDMIDAIMPVFKYMKFLQKNYWKSIERIPKVQKPILFIRCSKDEIVPTSQMTRLMQNVDQGIFYQEYEIPAGTHNCSWQLEKQIYFDKLNQFLTNPRVTQVDILEE